MQNGSVKFYQLCFLLVFYILGVGGLILFKTAPYDHSLSALIGIWEGFYEINPNLVDSHFVIYKSGGYDGQFFYLLAKDLFVSSDWDLIVDSYFFRFHRLGLSLLTGAISNLVGFSYYPIITLFILFSTFLISVFCLYSLLPKSKKWYVTFYLFSPFSLNANLLLVADSLFVSFGIIAFYFFKNKKDFLAVFFFFMMVITRELGVLFLIPIVYKALVEKRWKQMFIYSIPGFAFLCLVMIGLIHPPNHLGTNPLGFRDMTDFPLFGFFKSFQESGSFQFKLKEFPKILFFISLISITIASAQTLKNNFPEDINILVPIFGSLFVILIAEQGYWRSFDNLSRMFTLILPFSLLLEDTLKNLFLRFFLGISFSLFVFLIIRILWITPTKEFFFSL
ncbi:AZOBR_p60025 family cell surface glycopolymer formation protein [Leptospira meyeri]|uniref:AZOBR_p60025 family cell surface glycopolymer formation protein n=1 Tax=Leptospira meyeri TaxID=29508 RepID=UPI0002C009EA|nr:membrane protein [Leptospira meyeri]EMJ87712.1 putative membrane protein [Leptospira meyeri serovar Semaranga str. Veldrot Semarang 173]